MFTFFSQFFAADSLALYAAALLATLHGFRDVFGFLTTGYAFSFASMSIVSFFLYHHTLTPASFLQGAILIAYGLRLGLFVMWRNHESSYKGQLSKIKGFFEGTTNRAKVMMWLALSALYFVMYTPMLYKLRREGKGCGLGSSLIGCTIMIIGLVMEALADYQKSSYKRSQQQRYCDIGLYRWVRCPNYLGDIILWIGNWIAGICGYIHWMHWMISLLGLVAIIFILIDSTARLELAQDERYAKDATFQKYTKTVPVLVPFVHLYSFKSLYGK